MSHFALTDIGNPNLKVRKRTLQTFKDKNLDLKAALETYFNGYEIDIHTESLGNNKCHDPVHAEFQILDYANVRVSTSSHTLKAMFNKHLNMADKSIDNKESLTDSHRNFFYNLTKRTIATLAPEGAVISRATFEQTKVYNIQFIMELEIDQQLHSLFVAIEVNEKNNEFNTQSDFSIERVHNTVATVPIQLDATLMCKKYTLAQAKNMNVGDIIELDKSDKITLKVNNKPIFLGKLIVDENKQLGVKYE